MSKRTVSLLFLNVGHAYDHFFMLIYPTAVIALAGEFSQSYGALLALATVGFVAFGAGTLPAGWLGDRWSRTGMMTVFFLGVGAAAILTGLARTPFEIAVGLGLIGLFASIYHPIGTSLIVADAKKVGKALGINGVFGNFGVALAAITTGALTDLFGWRAAFLVPGAIAVLTGLLYAAFMRERRRTRIDAPVDTPKADSMTISRDARIRILIVLVVASLLGGVVFNASTVALPKIFEERLSALSGSLSGIGGLVSLVFGIAAFAQILVGHLLDRYAVKWVLVAVSIVQVPLFFLAVDAQNTVMLLVAVPLMFFIFGEIPVHDWIVAKYAAERWRSRAYAVKYVLSLGVSAVAVPLVAWLHGMTGGFGTLFLTLAGCAAVIAVTAALLLPLHRFAPAPAAAE